jgi:hypothetical protein
MKVKIKVVPAFNSAARHDDAAGNGGVPQSFIISALDGGEWLASRPGSFNRKNGDPVTHQIGVWVRARSGLDAVD